MKRVISIFASALLLAACSRQSSMNVGSSPNNDTGMGEHNLVVNAQPDQSAGTGGSNARGAALNESDAADTNNSAKPQLPPVR